MTKIKLIVAVSDNNIIGNKGEIPWKLPEEMKHFRDTTMNSTVVMGFKTWFSILPHSPSGYLLGRDNIVLTSSYAKCEQLTSEYMKDHPVLQFRGPDFDIKATREVSSQFNEDRDIFIIGGAQIYNKFLKEDVVDEIILSKVKMKFKGDAVFQDIDNNAWNLLSIENRQYFDILHYQRNK